MKNYKQFLNEDTMYLNNISITEDFEFIIDITNCTEEEINDAFKEFEKYTTIHTRTKKYLTTKDAQAKPWAWRVDLRNHWDKSYVRFGIITTKGWGIGNVDIIDDRITIQEFLEVGLEGVKDYIKKGTTYFRTLNTANKYNL